MPTNYWEATRPKQTTGSVAGIPGFSTAGVAGTAVRQPTGDELVENRLTKLLAGDSAYIQNARTRGTKQAAGRGLLNSSLAGAASEASAVNAGLPIASQDASAFSAANAQNQNDLNAATLLKYQSDLGNQANNAASYGGVSVMNLGGDERDYAFRREQAALDRDLRREDREAGREESGADRNFQREMTLSDRDFRRQEGESDRQYGERMTRLGQDFQRGMAGDEREYGRDMLGRTQGFAAGQSALDRTQRNREMYTSIFGGAMGQALGAMFSDPSFWGSPDAAAGFTERWGSTISGLLGRYGIGPGGG